MNKTFLRKNKKAVVYDVQKKQSYIAGIESLRNKRAETFDYLAIRLDHLLSAVESVELEIFELTRRYMLIKQKRQDRVLRVQLKYRTDMTRPSNGNLVVQWYYHNKHDNYWRKEYLANDNVEGRLPSKRSFNRHFSRDDVEEAWHIRNALKKREIQRRVLCESLTKALKVLRKLSRKYQSSANFLGGEGESGLHGMQYIRRIYIKSTVSRLHAAHRLIVKIEERLDHEMQVFNQIGPKRYCTFIVSYRVDSKSKMTLRGPAGPIYRILWRWTQHTPSNHGVRLLKDVKKLTSTMIKSSRLGKYSNELIKSRDIINRLASRREKITVTLIPLLLLLRNLKV